MNIAYSAVHTQDMTTQLEVAVEYSGIPGSRGYRTLAEGQLEPDTDPEIEIHSVSLSKYDAVARKHFKLDITEYLPDEVLQELTEELLSQECVEGPW